MDKKKNLKNMDKPLLQMSILELNKTFRNLMCKGDCKKGYPMAMGREDFADENMQGWFDDQLIMYGVSEKEVEENKKVGHLILNIEAHGVNRDMEDDMRETHKER